MSDDPPKGSRAGKFALAGCVFFLVVAALAAGLIFGGGVIIAFLGGVGAFGAFALLASSGSDVSQPVVVPPPVVDASAPLATSSALIDGVVSPDVMNAGRVANVGRLVTVKGMFTSVTSQDSPPSANLSVQVADEFKSPQVLCLADLGFMDAATKLTRGSEITVQGTVADKDFFGGTLLDKCTVLSPALVATAPAAVETPAEPVTTEPVVKTEPVKTEPVKTEPVKTEPVKTEPVKTEPVVKVEPVKAAAGGKVTVEGEGSVVLIGADGKRVKVPGNVPAGKYEIEATFEGEPAVVVGKITVGESGATVACNANMGICRPK